MCVMSQPKLTPATIAFLVLPTMLWAGNAIVGRIVSDMIPPVTLNFVRWIIAFLILLPFGYSVLRPSSQLWKEWKRYSILGLLSIGLYNTLQYMALQSSTPINVTLVGASMPIWMLLIGRVFFGALMNRWQLIGGVVSLCGVVIILTRGDLTQIMSMRLVIGDFYMILSTIAWAFYSWLLLAKKHPDDVRRNWATLLMSQVAFGTVWSGFFAWGEWAAFDLHIRWGTELYWAMAYVAIGPAIVALYCWGEGVQRAGPATAGFFTNFIPLFAALLSTLFLNEMPQTFHAIAFALIVGGIMLASRKRNSA